MRGVVLHIIQGDGHCHSMDRQPQGTHGVDRLIQGQEDHQD